MYCIASNPLVKLDDDAAEFSLHMTPRIELSKYYYKPYV